MVVGRRVVEVLLKGLNIKDIDKNKEHILVGGKGININYYPKCPELNWQLEWAVTMISQQSHSFSVITITTTKKLRKHEL
jgi:hypothetical protein